MAYVRGRSLVIGLVPVSETYGAQALDLPEGDRILGLLYWSPGVKIEVELPSGSSDWLSSEETGFILLNRGDFLALLRPEWDGLRTVGYLPALGITTETTIGSASVTGNTALIGPAPGTVILRVHLARSAFMPGVRIDIPLRVRFPENARTGWRVILDGR